VTGTLPISEIFGPTIQGEGPSAGWLAAFIRLGGCNLTCNRCDTPYTWDGKRYDLRAELTATTAADILAALPPAPLVVITGGEPTLYQREPAMVELVQCLVVDHDVEVETNGTRVPDHALHRWFNLRFNVSPKLAGPMSVDPEFKRIVPAALEAYADLARRGQATFKFVVHQRYDLDAVAALAERYHIAPHAIWCMPEGANAAAMIVNAQRIADAVIDAGFNLTLRQHLLLWPDTDRGR
jgi:7-carboxy-7-deazaguanine synthase